VYVVALPFIFDYVIVVVAGFFVVFEKNTGGGLQSSRGLRP
jgi:hypothetical protein